MGLETASVAMAVYNGERFLAQQVDSILPQLGPRDELVFSYDCSTDGTLGLIESYAADPRVRVVANGDPGVVGNFNSAISACTGDVVFISDQDDLWVPSKRNRVMARLNETGADLLIHDYVHIDANGAVVSGSMFEANSIGEGLLRNFAKPRYSGCCMAFPACTRDLILPMPKSVECYDHWIGVACEFYGRVDFYDEALLQHRLHDGNATFPRRPLGVILRQRANLLSELAKRRSRL